MRFRFHRGSLEESLQTVREVQSLDDVRELLVREVGLSLLPEHFKLTCRYYTHDKRIDWQTWIVLNDGLPVGFSDGELK